MTIVIIVALTLLAFAFVAYPLFKGRWQQPLPETGDADMEEIFSRKEATYSAIKELEFDHELGNLSTEDYQSLDKRYRGKAISILKDMDRLHRPQRAKGKMGRGALRVEEDIETEVMKLRQADSKDKGPVCPQCGAQSSGEDQFCSRCGASLAQRGPT